MNATPMKLQNGAWGIAVPGRPEVGDAVTVTTRAGKTWNAVISRVIERSGSVSLCATVSRSQDPRGYGHSRARGTVAPHRRRCPTCGSVSCPKAWNSRDLCEED